MMIDTMIATIPDKAFRITDHNRFDPPTDKVDEVSAGFVKFVNNPSLEDKKGGYYPRLTLIKRGYGKELKIEFSAPKLVFGNNLEELEESDFDKVVHTLHQRIKEMGVLIPDPLSITFAEVSSFHASKNILLSGGYTSAFAIKELYKINLTEKMDLTRVKFKNSGQALHYYATSYSVVFYDKIADLALPQRRRTDSDSIQFSIFEHPVPEILRMEARITNKNKLNALLEELGYPKNPLLKDVFNKTLCQKILLHYWNVVVMDKNQHLFSPLDNPQRIYEIMKRENPKMGSKEIIYLIGLDALSRDRGVRELKTVIKKYNSGKTWIRTLRDVEKLNALKPKDYGLGFMSDIEKALTAFEPYKPDFKLFNLST